MTFNSKMAARNFSNKKLVEEPEVVKTEEQKQAEKEKNAARIKQQHELNSRLSVKKSALSKMLDKQSRKERI